MAGPEVILCSFDNSSKTVSLEDLSTDTLKKMAAGGNVDAAHILLERSL